MSREYMNRGDNFLSTLRRSVESGTDISWKLMATQLGDLFYQTHRDGVEAGEKLGQLREHENQMMQRALTRLLEMGEGLVRRKIAGHKVTALVALEAELAACFREVVIDSLDLSGKKLDRLMEKFIQAIGQLTEDLKSQAEEEAK